MYLSVAANKDYFRNYRILDLPTISGQSNGCKYSIPDSILLPVSSYMLPPFIVFKELSFIVF